jgi:hypothetical protein
MVLLIAGVALFFANRSLRNALFQSETRVAELQRAADERLESELRRRESSERELEAERNRRIEAESELEKRTQALSSGQTPDFLTVVLRPVLSSRGGAGTLKEIRLGENVRWIRFEISARLYRDYESYAISIKLDGQIVLERPALKSNASGNLTFNIAASTLTPGDYLLVLSGRRNAGEAAEELDKYPLRINR